MPEGVASGATGDSGGGTTGGTGSHGGAQTPSGAAGADQVVAPATGAEQAEHEDPNEPPEKRAARVTAKQAAAKEAEAAKALKRKLKRMGADVELDADTAFSMLQDDYEHEFTGPGGKAVKLAWPDIARQVQLAQGAAARAQRAAEAEKKQAEAIEWGRKNPGAFIESQLGIDDHEAWAQRIAYARYQREQELTALATDNPSEYHRQIEQGVQQRLERKAALEKHRADSERRNTESKQQREAAQREATAAFKAIGLPWTAETREMASKIFREYQQADVLLKPADVADLTRKQYQLARRAELGAMPPEALFAMLGEDTRTKLRAAEVEAMKAAKTAERRAPDTATTKAPKTNGSPNGMTEAEIRRGAREGRI